MKKHFKIFLEPHFSNNGAIPGKMLRGAIYYEKKNKNNLINSRIFFIGQEGIENRVEKGCFSINKNYIKQVDIFGDGDKNIQY